MQGRPSSGRQLAGGTTLRLRKCCWQAAAAAADDVDDVDGVDDVDADGHDDEPP